MYAPASAASCRDLRDLAFQHAGMDTAVTENITSLTPYRFVIVWMVWQKHLTQPQSWLNLTIVDSSAKITFQHVFQVTHPPTKKKNIQKSSCNLSHDLFSHPCFSYNSFGDAPGHARIHRLQLLLLSFRGLVTSLATKLPWTKVSLKNGNSTNKKP